ncbi:MAG: hypothetical protein JWN33_37 [Candidatus Saccharibacteria bacterium]|nr:hypothetical protein [Candidatus Saccharibacteria bacterium]
MKNRLLIIIGLAILGALTLVSPAPNANAQSTSNGQALEIAPPVINLSLKPGQAITAQISLRDVSNGPLIVTGEINDFVAAGEDGTPKILTEAVDDNPYSMRTWIKPLNRLLLKPHEIQSLPVTITVPQNAAPGGYFAVVRFTATPPELEGTGVALSASLGSLILVRVEGDAKESMEIAEFNVSKDDKPGTLFQQGPVTFTERLKNTGTIHLQPTGQVIVSDMFGAKIATVNINLPPGNVLPNSIRRFSQPLDSSVIGNRILFGRYTAELKVTYGDSKQTISQTITFWVIPYTLIGIIVVALVIGFIFLRFGVKRYNRHIINSANKTQAKSKNKRK